MATLTPPSIRPGSPEEQAAVRFTEEFLEAAKPTG